MQHILFIFSLPHTLVPQLMQIIFNVLGLDLFIASQNHLQHDKRSHKVLDDVKSDICWLYARNKVGPIVANRTLMIN
mgnify:CR=1 FL=1